jgi:hypothetical protein
MQAAPLNEDKQAGDFSLVLGGPLYQLWLRLRVARRPANFQLRRILAIALVAWLPLLVASMIDGRAWPGSAGVSFLYDLEVHVRFLVALPLLVLAESVVHLRIAPVISAFTERKLVSDADRPRFDTALASAMRVRDSLVVEVLLLVFVFAAGHQIWSSRAALDSATWYGTPAFSGTRLTPAGWWYVFGSLPLFQFILLRWVLRIGLWIFVLLRISKLDLRLTPTHPDRCGGLGFLGGSIDAFVPILLAQGAVVAGSIANRIFYDGKRLTDFYFEAGGLIGASVLLVLGPLALFSGALARARRRGVREYGVLASRYGQEFEDKWLRGAPPADEKLLGNADVQSLADLGSGYEAVREMRTLPFGLDAVVRVALATAAPMLPLVLTMVPIDEILRRLVDMVL